MTPPEGARFELWRQDDNGNRVMIRRFDDRREADAEVARYESLGHRQIYWVEDRLERLRPGPS